MKQEIEVPEGMELDLNSIKFKPVKKKLPETWEELGHIEGFCIGALSKILDCECKTADVNKNVVPTYENAESILELCQLLQLRDVYRQGWKPDWTDEHTKFCIVFDYNALTINYLDSFNEVFSFRNEETALLFLENFKQSLEKYFKLCE